MGGNSQNRITVAHKARTTYISGWFTVGIPLILTFLIWFGIPLFVLSQMGWNASDWLMFLLCGTSLVLALALNVAIYPLLMRQAQRGQGELHLEGSRLRWRTGLRWKEVDFSRPHWAEINAGASGLGEANASIVLQPGGAAFHLRGARRREIVQAFPAPSFIGEMAVVPEEGLWGFSLQADAPAERGLFLSLLQVLWQHRGQNKLYHIFSKFPWDTPPRPAFSHIEMVEAKTCSEDMQALIKRLESEAISVPVPWLVATTDYLLGYQMNLLGETVRYFIMPLGHVHAETTLPKPDWGPFMLGHVVRTVAGGSGVYVPLEDKQYLAITGRGWDGRPLTVSLEWVKPGDEEYNEAEFLVRFINR